MSGNTEITRRWNGYVCPDCRFIFRVPKDHDGIGLVCPNCRRLLRLAPPSETLPPLIRQAAPELEPTPDLSVEPAPLEPTSEPQATATPALSARRRRHSRRAEAAKPDWESNDSSSTSSGQEKLLIIGLFIILFLIATIGLVAYFRRNQPVTEASPIASLQKLDLPHPVAGESPKPSETPVVTWNVRDFQRIAEPIARQFLQAKSVDEILPIIRHSDITKPRLEDYYIKGSITPLGLETFADDGIINLSEQAAFIPVRTQDFKLRTLIFFRENNSWKIDWESWVGWSEMRWEAFAEKAPTQPHLFRVLLKPVNYYNFEFSDEVKWRSYLVESPDTKHRFFAYIERGSELDQKISFIDSPTESLPYLLKLRFPEQNLGRNQILITDLIATSWLEPEPTDSP